MFLTTDMVPIHIGTDKCSFVCPLPKGYKKALQEFSEDDLNKELFKIISVINMLANQEVGPFVNIMIEYEDRKNKEVIKESLLITRIGIDKRGLYMALAGSDVNSGDIYLDKDASPCCDYTIINLERFFEEGVAFQCHNVDFYWQALLLRELTVEYFNLLNSKLKAKRWF
ncbi:MAG: hypothetical protein WC446_01865 [Candidatus Paceibacterota bacterium]|jgi:hypothetical protein